MYICSWISSTVLSTEASKCPAPLQHLLLWIMCKLPLITCHLGHLQIELYVSRVSTLYGDRAIMCYLGMRRYNDSLFVRTSYDQCSSFKLKWRMNFETFVCKKKLKFISATADTSEKIYSSKKKFGNFTLLNYFSPSIISIGVV